MASSKKAQETINEEMKLFNILVQNMQVRMDLLKKTHDLEERVKELQCLYGIVKLIDDPVISLSEICKGTIALIPPGWQYPEITCVRIVVDNQIFRSKNFRETKWKQTSKISVNGKETGSLEIFYLEERPELDEGPFLKEERNLIVAITEQLGKIIEKKQMEAELEKERNLLKAVIDNLPDYIYVKDKNSVFIAANKAVAEMMGAKTPAELIGKTDFEYFPEDEAEKFFADEQHVLRSGRAIIQVEESIRSNTGEKTWLSTTKVPVKGKNGNIIWIVGMGRDITKRKTAEGDRIYLEKQLQQSQKLKAIGTLAAGIAHEINTPMQFIGDNVRFLSEVTSNLIELNNTKKALFDECGQCENAAGILKIVFDAEREIDLVYLTEEIPRAILQTNEGIERVTKIVNAMKNFSRIDTEEETKADINRAIESTVTVSRNEWKYVADVKTDLDSSLPLVSCFLGDINQVVMNLIVNAAHAISEVVDGRGQDKGLITVSTCREDNNVVIKVTDTGPGIPDDIWDKIFVPFYTTKEVGKGTGQGLSMAYSAVVEKHGGSITFETEKGTGTTFIIKLPVDGIKTSISGGRKEA